jgi:hypothetical protein
VYSGKVVANAVIPVSMVSSSTSYVADKTGPLLLSYSYDVGRGTLKLFFDEPVLFVDGSLITFYSSKSMTDKFRMSPFSKADGDHGTNLTVTLCRYDFLELKMNSTVAATVSSIFLDVAKGAIYDLFGNPILALSALRAPSSFTTDSIIPAIAAFHYNHSTTNLTVYFNDVIDQSMTRVTVGYQQMAFVSSTGFVQPLGGALLDTQDNNYVIIVNLGTLQSATLFKTGIGQTQKNTLLYLPRSQLFYDTFGNNNAKMPVTSAIRDGNTVLSFWLDLENRHLYFEFVYPIRIMSIVTSQFSLSSVQTLGTVTFTSLNTSTAVGANFYRVPFSASDGTSIIEKLSFESRTDLRLSIGVGAFGDENGYQLSTAVTVPCSYLVTSTSTPALLSFSLNMGTGLLTMTFSKAVLVSSIRVTAISFCSSRGSNATIFQLTSSSTVMTTSVADTVIVISLNIGSYPNDRESLNIISGIATAASNIFLFADEGYASDPSQPPVYLKTIPQANATHVTSFTADVVPPALLSVNLDLTQRQLHVFFSEAVNVNSNHPPFYTLAQTTTNSLLAKRSLASSNTSYIQSVGRTIVMNISQIDFDAINFQSPNLCTSTSNCYLSIISGAVSDVSINANPILDVFFRFGVAISVLTLNRRPAVLNRFDVSMQNGTMQFYFSDVIRCSSLNLRKMEVQPLQFSGTSSNIYFLDNTTSFTCSGRNVRYIPLTFGLNNLKVIKAISTLLKSKVNSFLALNSGAFYDVSGNPNAAVSDGFALPVTGYIGDSVPPQLLSYTVTAQNVLIMNFNEPVDPITLTISQFSFQDKIPIYTKIYALSAATLTTVDTYKMQLSLTLNNDYFRIVTDSTVFSEQNTTYLSWGAFAVADMSGNELISLPTTQAMIMGPSVTVSTDAGMLCECLSPFS